MFGLLNYNYKSHIFYDYGWLKPIQRVFIAISQVVRHLRIIKPESIQKYILDGQRSIDLFIKGKIVVRYLFLSNLLFKLKLVCNMSCLVTKPVFLHFAYE